MDTCTDIQLQLASAVDDFLRAGDRPGWTVEAAEESIARRVDLNSSVERELTANSTMVLLQQVTPLPVSH